MSLWEYANPVKFLGVSTRILPFIAIGAAACLSIGLVWGFFFTPDDYRQGSTVKIIYLHVPSALMAINAWFMMLVASLIWLIRLHHVSALAAKAAAPAVARAVPSELSGLLNAVLAACATCAAPAKALHILLETSSNRASLLDDGSLRQVLLACCSGLELHRGFEVLRSLHEKHKIASFARAAAQATSTAAEYGRAGSAFDDAPVRSWEFYEAAAH